ncbi:hypothetical protein GT037_008913 [Alternaria burnsii]|uniref:Uncharacterized protein n=1 Tax=Alternaria burnsii TaxID=1187904 RepID=A0A8H7B0B1_9PLEO|nr:uncharacterized protein GT037_008913 [Alternaria burnsii]KAF7672962.1 hypothetical protein GT037_008913 [Alternaria burnsii]CAI9633359.1 unnamed protein product [Alternaria burnsii]
MASDSPFLRLLPAEIRNAIYELALTAPEPLRCFDPVVWDDYNPNKKRHYLYFRVTSTNSLDEPAFDVDPVEYNQFKYVSKELHAETVGLELKYNDIMFRVSKKSENATSFLLLNRWLSTIPVAKRSWIKTINIRMETKGCHPPHKMPEDAHTIARLTRLCNDNPLMIVKYHLPKWRVILDHRYYIANLPGTCPILTTPTAICFISDAADVYSYIRGEGVEKLYPGPPFKVGPMLFARRWREIPGVDLADLQAKNLTYFPDVPEGTHIPFIKKDLTWAAHGEVVPEAEQWIGYKYAKDWVENGI